MVDCALPFATVWRVYIIIILPSVCILMQNEYWDLFYSCPVKFHWLGYRLCKSLQWSPCFHPCLPTFSSSLSLSLSLSLFSLLLVYLVLLSLSSSSCFDLFSLFCVSKCCVCVVLWWSWLYSCAVMCVEVKKWPRFWFLNRGYIEMIDLKGICFVHKIKMNNTMMIMTIINIYQCLFLNE